MLRPLIFLSFLLTAEAAWGHIPTPDRIVSLWQGAYEKLAPVTLKGSWQQGAISVPFEVSILKGGISIVENGKPSTDATSQLVWDLLFIPATALQKLQSRGLVMEQTGLARTGTAIAWTLGATGENRRGTQIWIDREWLNPHRVVLQNSLNDADTIEYLDFNPANHLYPSKIRSRVGGIERVFRIDDIKR